MVRFLGVFGSLFFGICGFLVPTAGYSQSCNPRMPMISVSPILGQTTTLDAYDVAFASGNKFQIEASLPNGRVLRGTASTPVGYQFSMNGRGTFTCYEPISVEVKVGLIHDAKIVVDAHYYPNSCNYQAILDHENQHVEIARSSVALHTNTVRMAVEQAVAQILPSLSFYQNAAEVMKSTIERALTSSLVEIRQEMDRRNAQLDSPQSYQMTQDRCPSW